MFQSSPVDITYDLGGRTVHMGIRKGRKPLARGLGCPQNIFINNHRTVHMGIRKGRKPLTRGLGCPQNIFLFYFPMGNIGSRAARATARGAPTGLHCLNVYRAAYALKQTLWGGAFTTVRHRWQGGHKTNTTR